MNKVVFSTAYLPPVAYMAAGLKYGKFFVCRHETYPKQTYRNRAVIYAANGILPLYIPVKKPYGNRTITKDIIIDYNISWQRNHWNSIYSAYKSSPFFDFFAQDIEPFYYKKYRFLLDFNTELLNKIIEILELDINIEFSEDFVPLASEITDLRNAINPKKKIKEAFPNIKFPKYYQVFSDKHGFVPNLSIIDTLFNIGNETPDYLTLLDV